MDLDNLSKMDLEPQQEVLIRSYYIIENAVRDITDKFQGLIPDGIIIKSLLCIAADMFYSCMQADDEHKRSEINKYVQKGIGIAKLRIEMPRDDDEQKEDQEAEKAVSE